MACRTSLRGLCLGAPEGTVGLGGAELPLLLWRVRHAVKVVPVLLLQLVVGLQWRRGRVLRGLLRPLLLLLLRCWARAAVPVPVAVAVWTEVAAGLLLLPAARCFSSGAPVAVQAGEEGRHPVHQHCEEQRQDEDCNEQVSVALY